MSSRIQLYGGREGAGGGGGVFFPDPPRVFAGATLAAARTARDAHFNSPENSMELAEYQQNQYQAILLRPNTGDPVIETYLTGNENLGYDSTQWVDRGSPGVTDAHVNALIAAYDGSIPSLDLSEGQIPVSIARDTEIAAAIANLRGGVAAAYDTLDELADALIDGITLQNGVLFLNRVSGVDLGVDVTGLAKTDSQINALIQAALAAAVEGNVETRITVTYANGRFNYVVADQGGGGGTGVPLAQALAAILAGSGITVDRTTPNQITISSTGGSSATIPDDSISYEKILATTTAQKEGWRSKIGAEVPPSVQHLPVLVTNRLYYLTQDSAHPAAEQFFSGVPGEVEVRDVGEYFGWSRGSVANNPPALNKTGQDINDVLPAASGLYAIYKRGSFVYVILRADKGTPDFLHLDAHGTGVPNPQSTVPLTGSSRDLTIGGTAYKEYSGTPGRTFMADATWSNFVGNSLDIQFAVLFGTGDRTEYLRKDGTKESPTVTPAGYYIGFNGSWLRWSPPAGWALEGDVSQIPDSKLSANALQVVRVHNARGTARAFPTLAFTPGAVGNEILILAKFEFDTNDRTDLIVNLTDGTNTLDSANILNPSNSNDLRSTGILMASTVAVSTEAVSYTLTASGLTGGLNRTITDVHITAIETGPNSGDGIQGGSGGQGATTGFREVQAIIWTDAPTGQVVPTYDATSFIFNGSEWILPDTFSIDPIPYEEGRERYLIPVTAHFVRVGSPWRITLGDRAPWTAGYNVRFSDSPTGPWQGVPTGLSDNPYVSYRVVVFGHTVWTAGIRTGGVIDDFVMVGGVTAPLAGYPTINIAPTKNLADYNELVFTGTRFGSNYLSEHVREARIRTDPIKTTAHNATTFQAEATLQFKMDLDGATVGIAPNDTLPTTRPAYSIYLNVNLRRPQGDDDVNSKAVGSIYVWGATADTVNFSVRAR